MANLVGRDRPMLLEIILGGLWFVGAVIFLILVSSILRERKHYNASQNLYFSESPVFPDRIALLRKHGQASPIKRFLPLR